MPKHIKTTLKFVTGVLIAMLLYIAGVLLHGTFTDYQPNQIISLEAEKSAPLEIIEDSILSFTSWNLGYGGLGAESDFFYDHGNLLFSGGRMVRAAPEQVMRNISASAGFVTSVKSDFFLFQETDLASKRSYYINQFERISNEIPAFSAFFAPNYKVARVPIPLLEPWKAYGRTLSGLATYCRFQPEESLRLQLPGEFGWPTRIFQLDRCVSVHRFKLKTDEQLVVVNVHNSAYDSGGELKRKQMAFLRELFLREYEKGNYVVVGGDWNQCPPYFRYDSFMPGKTQGYTQINIAAEFLPEGWQWVYDASTPTNRKTRSPYKAGESFVTLIDFFLISPNVQVLSVKTIAQDFQFSDHQPVWMEVKLLKRLIPVQ